MTYIKRVFWFWFWALVRVYVKSTTSLYNTKSWCPSFHIVQSCVVLLVYFLSSLTTTYAMALIFIVPNNPGKHKDSIKISVINDVQIIKDKQITEILYTSVARTCILLLLLILIIIAVANSPCEPTLASDGCWVSGGADLGRPRWGWLRTSPGSWWTWCSWRWWAPPATFRGSYQRAAAGRRWGWATRWWTGPSFLLQGGM